MYNIKTDAKFRLVHVTMSGFLQPGDVEQFSQEEQKAVDSLGLRAEGHIVLVDTTALRLQSQDVVSAFQKLIIAAPCKARKIAILVGDSVSRMQAKRLKGCNRLNIFSQEHEAKDWLLDKRPEQGVAAAS